MGSIATTLARHLAPTDARTDGDLLAGFAAGSESDFAELVRRHGPMVWGVCRRALPDAADAEDAFQAVFLVLVRRARRLTSYPTVGPWLHRVAAWTARNVRRRNARRLANRVPLPDQLPAPAADPDLTLDLDAALLALPEKYRSPIVLCHLLGFTRAEAATRLGCPEGTLSAWLSRGLAKLRAKCGGLDPAKALGVAAVAVPAGLSASAVRAAVASRVAVAAVPSAVSQLAEGVLHMFWVKKATAAAAALFVVFALGVGVGLSGRQIVPDVNGQEKVAQPNLLAAGTDAREHAMKVRELESAIQRARAELESMRRVIALMEAKLALYENNNDAVSRAERIERLLGRDPLAEYRARADEATKRLQRLTDELAKLKAKQPDGGKPVSFVEVTLRGEAAKFDFVIRETDATGKVLGTATVNGPEMLGKILARTKGDPTAPKELRLVAEPPTALGAGPADLFKACDAAGYKSVKFTGYVVSGGFTPALKPDQKGEVGGYKRYDNAEKSPADLLKEHQEGMVRF